MGTSMPIKVYVNEKRLVSGRDATDLLLEPSLPIR